MIRQFIAPTLLLTLILAPLAATAQQEPDRTPSHCIALTQNVPEVQFISLPDVAEEEVHLHYIAHASFLIRSHRGLNMVTDYTGFTGTLPFIPDVVTMNKAHETHWTAFPDPAIPHVLPGWGEPGEGIEHKVELGEVLVRNVSTDIRSQWSGVEDKGNSIFVFEMAGLCIGHLGHLHHVPDAAQFAALGRLDVVMAPVDGGYTMSLPEMIQVIKRLRSSVVIPMHWFSGFSLRAFLDGMEGEFAVVEVGGPSLTISRDRLPSQPTIMLLQPAYLNVPR